MKIFLIFLYIGLTFTEKLDRTYLPPPGYSLSGGSPGDLNLPLELPNTKYNDGGFSKEPELVIGIDRVSSNQADDIFEDISAHKPKIIYNANTFTTPLKPSSVFKQLSPFPKDEVSTLIPDFNYNPGHPLNDLDNLQKIYNVEEHTSISKLNEKNRVYLPSYGDIYNTDQVLSITLPSPINSEKNINDERKYTPVSGTYNITFSLNPNNQQFDAISSTVSPNYPTDGNINIKPSNPNYSTVLESSTTIPTNSMITGKGSFPIFSSIINQRPERVQTQADRQAVILNYDQTITPEGYYAYNYDTSNVIHGNEEGTASNGVKAKGSYSYIGDDGNFYQVEYTADENGFVPKGAHLPTAPPIPDAILKVIEQAAKDKEAGIYDDGSYNEEKYGYKNLGDKKPSNIVSGANFLPDNVENVVRSGLFDEYVNSRAENGIQVPVEGNQNEFSDMVMNYNDYDDENSPSKDIVTSKKEEDFLPNSDLDVSISDENNETHPQTMSNHKYFPPQSYDINKIKALPPGFYEKHHHMPTKINKNNTEKVTAKPFLTPYVTRKEDDSEIKDYDEQLVNNQLDTDFDEQSHRDEFEDGGVLNYENVPNDFNGQQKGITNVGIESNDKLASMNEEIDTGEYISGEIPRQELQYGDEIYNINHLVPSDEQGYFYHHIHKPFITLNPRVTYATSTAATTKFPAGINIKNINFTSRRPSSLQIPTISSTTQSIDTSTKLPVSSQTMYTIRPGVLISKPTSTNSDTVLITTTPKTTARPGSTRFSMQYRPSTESSKYSDVYSGQTSTENIIGDDFTGSKQPQRFDSITGYHY